MLAGNSLKTCVGAGFEISSTLVQASKDGNLDQVKDLLNTGTDVD